VWVRSLFMNRLIASIVCAASCLATSVAATESPLANLPILGSWKLNVVRSSGANLRLVVTVSPSGRIDMTSMGLSATFQADGKAHPAFGVMATWVPIGPRAWDAVAKERDHVASIDHYVLSADEKTLTVTTETPGRALGAAETLVVTRVSGGPGLSGVWQGRRSIGDAAAEYAVENGRFRIRLSPSGEQWIGRLDGNEYPWSMPGAERNRLTAAGRRVDSRTISLVLKVNGVPFHYATLSVSTDGQTLQIDQVHGRKPDAPERSRLIYERR
jgi:hypothetical protein